MSKAVALVNSDLTPEQLALVTSTVAKGATKDELNLFLYRCQEMGLDPLKPGQIHFVKYGNSPGTIVIGIEGFRVRAERTGKHTGTQRGIIRDEKGKCIGAWCEVYRKDWTHPAREEVSLTEYSTGKGPWAKMPETMIRKVAEAAALRLAFPDQLGGIYSTEEMDQAQPPEPVNEQYETAKKITQDIKNLAENKPLKNYAQQSNPLENSDDPGEYVVQVLPFEGKKIKDCDPKKLESIVLQLIEAAKDPERAKKMTRHYEELMQFGGDYLQALDRQPLCEERAPFFDEGEEFP